MATGLLARHPKLEHALLLLIAGVWLALRETHKCRCLLLAASCTSCRLSNGQQLRTHIELLLQVVDSE